MKELESIRKFGVAKIPSNSETEQTAVYTTTSWANDSKISHISMFAKKHESDDSVELPTSLLTIKSED